VFVLGTLPDRDARDPATKHVGDVRHAVLGTQSSQLASGVHRTGAREGAQRAQRRLSLNEGQGGNARAPARMPFDRFTLEALGIVRQQGQALAQGIGQSSPDPRSRPLANWHDAGSDQVRTVARSDQRDDTHLARPSLAAHERGAA
jgi:hypothetical protein